MPNRFLAIAMFLTAINWSHAAGLEGSWTYETKQKPSDFFSVELFQNGRNVCGQVNASSMGTNRIDTTFVVGKVSGNVAEVEFASMFNEKGARGHARIEVEGERLLWQVTRELTPSYIWEEGRLSLAPWDPRHKGVVDAWCKDRWQKMEAGAFSEINLQP